MAISRWTISSQRYRSVKYRVFALLIASRSRPDSYLSKVNPLPSFVKVLKGWTVSLRPPVSRTIGTVP